MFSASHALRAGLFAAGVLAVSGCLVEGPEGDLLEIANETDVAVEILLETATVRTVPPHESRTITIRGGSPDGCQDWTLRAVVDSSEIARIGPPVCGGEWAITPDMLSEPT